MFTKLLRLLVKCWRLQGRRVVIYIDGGICASVNAQEARKHSAGILADLIKRGRICVLNTIKSRLDPHQLGEWLGFVIDLAAGCFHVPDEKIDRLRCSIPSLLHPSKVHIRVIASVVGKIMSMSLALGPVARLHTRAWYADINQCVSWHVFAALSDESRAELVFFGEQCKGVKRSAYMV